MGQAERLHVFPWRSPPCFSSSHKAHWLAAFVSCHLTPCRWTRAPTLEVQQCCSRCSPLFVTGAQPPSDDKCLVARIVRYSGFVWRKLVQGLCFMIKGQCKIYFRPESKINYFCNCHYSSSYPSATSKPANLDKTCEKIIYFLAKLKCHICRLISYL